MSKSNTSLDSLNHTPTSNQYPVTSNSSVATPSQKYQKVPNSTETQIPPPPPPPPTPDPKITADSIPTMAGRNDADLNRLLSKPLSPTQLQAIALLAAGQSDTAVAAFLGIHRQTVNRWRLYHPVFISRLNRARAALWSNTLDRLRSALPDAVDILVSNLKHADRPTDKLKSALMLLKLSGTSRLAPRVGPTSAFDVLTEIAEARRARVKSHYERKAEGPLQHWELEAELEAMLEAIETPQTPDLPLPPSTSDLQPPTSDLRPPTSDLRHLTSDIRHPTPDIRHPTSDI